VVVRAPWYATTWAYLAYLLLTLGLLAFALFYFDRRQREKLDEQKMRFLINATHDIRSPLTLILGPLGKLKQRVTDAQSLEDINTIDRNAQRLLLLVNQILDERKIDKNQMRLHCTPTDLVAFISSICSLYQYNARQRNISFNFEHADSALEAWIDRNQFDKVVSNLLSNAFKYSQDGGEVTVSLTSDSNNAYIKVTDNGMGFGTEKTDKLFERFYQGLNTEQSGVEGTGIGLNLSRSIVLLHG
jgi:signal transduction histidine kinase